ncbi:MAG: endonuclease/exonuclease/phosphatase family protein [Desulfobulbaceae bacterium]|nr:endonuclease/exonuclease/phosphatase family protein [Desulfobulbaceae bacterium]
MKPYKLYFVIVIIASGFLLSSCSKYIPKRHVLESKNNFFVLDKDELNSLMQSKEESSMEALNGSSIEILSWNTMASCKNFKKNFAGFVFSQFICRTEEWSKTFKELSKNKDILVLQEAYLDQDVLDTINSLGKDYKWDMAVSYIEDEDNDIPTGVMSISKTQSIKTYIQRAAEPVFPTPKATLYTEYYLKRNQSGKILDETLLVVNVHAILMGREDFQIQLEEIRKYINLHKGPVILAGDFNTMTSGSTEILNSITNGLEKVTFSGVDNRTESVCGYPYDFIFYRGLRLKESRSPDLSKNPYSEVSDHNPISATFELE